MRAHPVKLAVGLAISFGALALSLRGVSFAELWAQLLLANYWYVLLHVVLLLGVQLFRTVRWGLLVAPVKKLSFRRLLSICAVGFMALLVLPLRLGEFARPYLLREPGRVSGSAAMVSIVLERLIDGLTVAGALVVLLLGLPASVPYVGWARRGGLGVFVLFAGLLVFLAAARWRRQEVSRLLRAVARWSPMLSRRLESFAAALTNLPSARAMAGVLLSTGLYWGLNGLATWVLALGFGLHLTMIQAYTCVAIRAIGAMIPAGPGMVGTFQASMQVGLAMFLPGLDAARSAAYANVLWACQFGQQVALGLLFMHSSGLAADQHTVTLTELSHADEALDGP